MNQDLVTHVVEESVLLRKRSDARFVRQFPIAWKPMIDSYLKGLSPSQILREGHVKGNPVKLSELVELIRDVEGDSSLYHGSLRRQAGELDLAPSWFESQYFSLKLWSERNFGLSLYAGFYFLAFMTLGLTLLRAFQPFSLSGFLFVNETYDYCIVGLIVGMSVLGLTKGLLLVILHLFATGSIPETRLAWRGLMIDLSVDTSPIEAQRHKVLKLVFFLCSSMAYIAAATLWAPVTLLGLNPMSLTVLALLMTFVSLNPKRRGETSSIFGILFPNWKARRYLSYFENRSLFAFFRKGHVVDDESHLLLYAGLCITWSVTFLFFLITLMFENIRDLMVAWRVAHGPEWFSLLFVILIFSGIILLVLSELWRVLVRNLLFLFQRQIHNFLRNRSIRTEKVFDTDKVREFLANSPLFQGFPDDVIDGFLGHGYIQVVKVGQSIIVQGNVGTELYMILDGEAVVRRQEPTGEINDVAVLSKGAIFGEMSLLRNVVRTAHVVALSPVRVFVLPKSDFENLFQGLANGQTLEQRIALSGVLGDSSVFTDLPKESLQIILNHGSFAEYKVGQTIIEQGDGDKDFYILLRGQVEVVRAGDMRLALIGPAGFFGEVALFENRPRSATVRVIEDCVVLKLSQQGFWELMDQNLPLAANIQEVSWLRRQAPMDL